MRLDIPRMKSEDVEPILMLLSGLEKTKSKHAKMAITKLIVAYCNSLSAAGLHIYQPPCKEESKPGQITPVNSSGWFGR